MNNNTVFFINDSWNYIKKEINMNNFTITYLRQGGYKSKEQAELEYSRSEERYKKDLERIKKIANINYTFKEYLSFWVKEILIPQTDTSSKALGIWTVNQIIMPHIEKDILINYVTADYLNDIIAKCIPVCESAGKMTIRFMRNILRSAYAQKLIHLELWNDLMPVPNHIPKIQILNKEDLSKLLQEASKHPGYYFEILLATFAGLRSGEIRGLRYDDFDEKNKLLRVQRQYTFNYHLADNNGDYKYVCYAEEKEPKGNSSRILRIPDFLFDELHKKKSFNNTIIKNMKAKGKVNLDENHIAISPYGTIKAKGTLTSALKRTCNHIGVHPISFHGLRHQFATMLLEKGVTLEHISHLLGHKSVMTTFNIYCGIMDADTSTRNVIETLIPYTAEEGEKLWL